MRGDSEEGAPASDLQELRTVTLLAAGASDNNHPQATLFDYAADTARAIEDLVRSGLEQEGLSVLFGAKAEILVSFQPVVDFTDDRREDCGQPAFFSTLLEISRMRKGGKRQ
jgi:hypothetical protein